MPPLTDRVKANYWKYLRIQGNPRNHGVWRGARLCCERVQGVTGSETTGGATLQETDCIIIGAGVIGLAIARALAMTGLEVIILEKEGRFGSVTSARNSEVIHAGLYYPEQSLKARFCVAGKRALYEFCKSHHVSHRACGKVIVAAEDDELPALEGLARQGARNGVDDLRLLSAREVHALEPEVRAVGGLWSPDTGILDSHEYMTALLGEAEAASASLACHTPFAGAEVTANGFAVRTGGSEPFRLRTSYLVNAAGLGASDAARRIEGLDLAHVPETRFAKGNYFSLQGVKPPFRHLVYPLPVRHGLGVHATIDMAGQVKFGPDVEWIDDIRYDLDQSRAGHFAEAIRRYWSALPEHALQVAYAGIRPKISGPGEAAADFRIDGPGIHGIPGLVNLFGIESPGLTSSLAIADHVREMLLNG